ncbi:MAG: pyridoxal phosphate-dependent class II aminotransferase [Nitrospirae bacterium]|nr:pyridoxal phosphate-dependent class II aminotransferase [Nitrospirota bacterium]
MRLREYIGRHNNISPEMVLCGNGSTELIYLIARALRPERVLIPAPSFSEYERACRMSNELRVMSYELERKNNFDIRPDDFIKAMFTPPPQILMTGVGQAKIPSPLTGEGQGGGGLWRLLDRNNKVRVIAFLCNPNNPTGRLLKREEVMKIAEAAKRAGCCLIVDEAFIDFCPEHTVINEVQNNPYLIVLRSITKFHALPGLRIGYGVFPRHLIGKLKEYKEPWSVNSLAERAAIAALKDRKYREETFSVIRKEKQFLIKSFQKLGIEFLDSAANFYLLKISNAGDIYQALKTRGILVRDCSNFKGLDGTYIRVAVKSHKENVRLIKGLSGLLSLDSNYL